MHSCWALLCSEAKTHRSLFVVCGQMAAMLLLAHMQVSTIGHGWCEHHTKLAPNKFCPLKVVTQKFMDLQKITNLIG